MIPGWIRNVDNKLNRYPLPRLLTKNEVDDLVLLNARVNKLKNGTIETSCRKPGPVKASMAILESKLAILDGMKAEYQAFFAKENPQPVIIALEETVKNFITLQRGTSFVHPKTGNKYVPRYYYETSQIYETRERPLKAMPKTYVLKDIWAAEPFAEADPNILMHLRMIRFGDNREGEDGRAESRSGKIEHDGKKYLVAKCLDCGTNRVHCSQQQFIQEGKFYTEFRSRRNNNTVAHRAQWEKNKDAAAKKFKTPEEIPGHYKQAALMQL